MNPEIGMREFGKIGGQEAKKAKSKGVDRLLSP